MIQVAKSSKLAKLKLQPITEKNISNKYENFLNSHMTDMLFKTSSFTEQVNLIIQIIQRKLDNEVGSIQNSLILNFLRNHAPQLNDILKGKNQELLHRIMVKKFKYKKLKQYELLHKETDVMSHFQILLEGKLIQYKRKTQPYNKEHIKLYFNMIEELFLKHQKYLQSIGIRDQFRIYDVILNHRKENTHIYISKQIIQGEMIKNDDFFFMELSMLRFCLLNPEFEFDQIIHSFIFIGDIEKEILNIIMQKLQQLNANFSLQNQKLLILKQFSNIQLQNHYKDTFSEELKILRGSVLFQHISEAQQFLFFLQGQELNYQKGNYIYLNEDTNNFIYILMKGEVQLQNLIVDRQEISRFSIKNILLKQIESIQEKNHVSAVITKGIIFGEEIFLDDSDKKTSSAYASEDSIVVQFSKESVMNCINQNTLDIFLEYVKEKQNAKQKKLDTQKVKLRKRKLNSKNLQNQFSEQFNQLSFNLMDGKSTQRSSLQESQLQDSQNEDFMNPNENFHLNKGRNIKYKNVKGTQQYNKMLQNKDQLLITHQKYVKQLLNDFNTAHTDRYIGRRFKTITDVSTASCFLKGVEITSRNKILSTDLQLDRLNQFITKDKQFFKNRISKIVMNQTKKCNPIESKEIKMLDAEKFRLMKQISNAQQKQLVTLLLAIMQRKSKQQAIFVISMSILHIFSLKQNKFIQISKQNIIVKIYSLK